MKTPRCPIHKRALVCPCCVGAKGGRAKTVDKVAASRRNGKLGGGHLHSDKLDEQDVAD